MNGGIFITLSDLLKIVNKYKKNITRYDDLTKRIISIIDPTYIASPSMYDAIYKGTREITGCQPINPFPKRALYSFFSEHLKIDKIVEISKAFDIPDNVVKHFDTLLHAIVEKIKLQFENGNSNTSDDVKDIYLRLIGDSSSLINREIKGNELSFLNEVGKLCPLCKRQKLLLSYLSHNDVCNYKITQIFPEKGLTADKKSLFNTYNEEPNDHNSGINLIALCPICSNIYNDNKDYETYKKLVNIKKSILKDAAIDEAMDTFDIREAISFVIDNLKEIRDVSKMEELSLNAREIDEKIPKTNPHNALVKTRVNQFFHYINLLLTELERNNNGLATDLAQNIKQMSSTLMLSGCNEEEVLDQLAYTINNKIGGDKKTMNACHCVVAYFVAHCEVLTR